MKKKYSGFSLVEVLMLFAALSVILAVSAPLLTKHHKNTPQKMPHGFYQCYRDNNGKLHEELYNSFRRIDTNGDKTVETCSFTPPAGVTLFKITLIGAGTGGYLYASVDDTQTQTYNATYTPGNYPNGYSGDLLYRKLSDNEFKSVYTGKDVTYCSYRSASGGSASGVTQQYYMPGGSSDGLYCEGTQKNIFDYLLVTGTITGPDLPEINHAYDRTQSVNEKYYDKNDEAAAISNAKTQAIAKWCAGAEAEYNKNWTETLEKWETKYGNCKNESFEFFNLQAKEEYKDKDALNDKIKNLQKKYNGDSSIDAVLSRITNQFDTLCKEAGWEGTRITLDSKEDLPAPGGKGGSGMYYKHTYQIPNSINVNDYKAYLYRTANAGKKGYCKSFSNGKCEFSTTTSAPEKGADGVISNIPNPLMLTRGRISGCETGELCNGNNPKVNKNADIETKDGSDGTRYGALSWTDPRNENGSSTIYYVTPGTKGFLGNAVTKKLYVGGEEWVQWIAEKGGDGTSGQSGVNGNGQHEPAVSECTDNMPETKIETNLLAKTYTLGKAGKKGEQKTYSKFDLGKQTCDIWVGEGTKAHTPDSAIVNKTNTDFLSVDTVLSCPGAKLVALGGREVEEDHTYQISPYVPDFRPDNVNRELIQGFGPKYTTYLNGAKTSIGDNVKKLIAQMGPAKGLWDKFTYPSFWLRHIVNGKNIQFGKAGDGTQFWDRCTWIQGSMNYSVDNTSKSININDELGLPACKDSDYSGSYTPGQPWNSKSKITAGDGIGGGIFIRW